MTEVHWLVDGLNVIGSRPDGWWRDRPGAMRRLTAEVAGWLGGSGDTATLVFDGRPVELPPNLPSELMVVFAPGGRDAGDDEIVRRAGAQGQGRERVVTSDAHLRARVGALGVEVVGSRRFRELLGGGRAGRA